MEYPLHKFVWYKLLVPIFLYNIYLQLHYMVHLYLLIKSVYKNSGYLNVHNEHKQKDNHQIIL